MCVSLWCRIFGHKFYYVDFHPTHYKRHVGVTYDFETLEGYNTQRDVTFCTRCGRERAEIVEETRTLAQLEVTHHLERAGMECAGQVEINEAEKEV